MSYSWRKVCLVQTLLLYLWKPLYFVAADCREYLWTPGSCLATQHAFSGLICMENDNNTFCNSVSFGHDLNELYYFLRLHLCEGKRMVRLMGHISRFISQQPPWQLGRRSKVELGPGQLVWNNTRPWMLHTCSQLDKDDRLAAVRIVSMVHAWSPTVVWTLGWCVWFGLER
jgi:hypothetical protein